MDTQRELRRKVDDLFRSNKTRQFTIEGIASSLATDEESVKLALSTTQCPFGACQSYDTSLSKALAKGFEVHRCNRCNREFQVQREPGGYSYLGWYGE